MGTYFKLVVRGIRNNLNRFLSILGIVALGTGFLSGLSATGPDMLASADRYYKDSNMYDINIRATMGFTADDVKRVQAVSGVETVMPANVTDAVVADADGEQFVARLYGTELGKYGEDSYINKIVLTEGRLPEEKNECVIVAPNRYSNEYYNIGESLVLIDDGGDTETLQDRFNVTEYTVVGLAESPLFISIESETSTVGNGSVSFGMYVYDSCFSLDGDVNTDLFIRLEGAAGLNTYSHEYSELSDRLTELLEAVGAERSDIRYNEIVSEAERELGRAETELGEARREAEEELDRAWRLLTDGKEEIRNNEARLADALSSIAASEKQLSDAEAGLEAGYSQWQLGSAELERHRPEIEALVQLQQSGAALPPELALQIEEFNKNEAELKAAKEQLDKNSAGLESGRAALEAAKLEYADGVKRLEEAKAELAEGEASYNAEKAKAEAELADAEKRLEEARAELESTEKPEWLLFGRDFNTGYSSYKTNVDNLSAIAKVFPVFFFLVAALVASTTMTRLVEEERGQIGALKSLGYGNGAILCYYFIYSGLASLLGCAVGLALGFRLLPAVISNAYSMMYTLPKTETPFIWPIAAVVAPVIMVCILLTSFFACKKELRDRPAALLVAKAPKEGKRIFLEHIGFIWKRLSFTHKVTARNLFRYKKRLIMTILGVAGCSALLVTGFGIRDSIGDIVDKQFGEIYRYDMSIVLNAESNSGSEGLSELLGDESLISDFAYVHSEPASAAADGVEYEFDLYVPERTEELTEFIRLRQRNTGRELGFDQASAVITEKLAEKLGLKAGDSLRVMLESGREADITVTAITENYIASFLYLGREAYNAAFGEPEGFGNVLAVISPAAQGNTERVTSELLKAEEVSYIVLSDTIEKSFSDTLKNIDYVVYVLIIAAGALAVIVLYNLTNINICERVKELATIKVLGFYDREVSNYIFREINILSVLGGLIGLAGGVLLHRFVILTVELEEVMFGRSIYLPSFILAFAITVVFTLLVNFIMTFRLRRIDMVESLKAPE